MSYFDKPVVLMFMGSPGSGKSYFARHIADKIGAVRLNSDSMRLAIFGSLEEMDRVEKRDGRQKLIDYPFGAMDYTTDQIISKGIDVVYDANSNRRVFRQALQGLAQKYAALPVVVNIETPYEVALKRGQTREAQADQRQFDEEKMRHVMDRILANTEQPTADEFVITIDGQLPFEAQFESFKKQLEAAYVH